MPTFTNSIDQNEKQNKEGVRLHNKEIKGLLDMYKNCNGEYWKNNGNWNTSISFIDRKNGKLNWYGLVFEDTYGRLSELRLGNNNVRGEFPYRIMYQFLMLKLLDVSNNEQLHGILPDDFHEKVHNIEYIYLHNTKIQSVLPKISTIQNLHILQTRVISKQTGVCNIRFVYNHRTIYYGTVPQTELLFLQYTPKPTQIQKLNKSDTDGNHNEMAIVIQKHTRRYLTRKKLNLKLVQNYQVYYDEENVKYYYSKSTNSSIYHLDHLLYNIDLTVQETDCIIGNENEWKECIDTEGSYSIYYQNVYDYQVKWQKPNLTLRIDHELQDRYGKHLTLVKRFRLLYKELGIFNNKFVTVNDFKMVCAYLGMAISDTNSFTNGKKEFTIQDITDWLKLYYYTEPVE